MNSTVFDRRRVQPISCDILVVGSGAAGLAAAVTASRAGKKVVILERYGFSGGGAVAGLSGTVCGLYLATDAQSRAPEQVIHGFAGEFCAALDRVGGLTGPIKYGKTWTRVHDPLKWREVSDGLLRQSGVQVIYHSVATGVLIEGDSRVEGVMAWTKQGPLRINAKLVVDASGDADVVAMAGFRDTIGDNGRVQNPTMIFTLQGVDVQRFSAHYGTDSIMNESVSQLIRDKNSAGEYVLPRSKIWLFPTTQSNELLCNATRVCGDDGRELNSLFYEDFTEAEINGRVQAREYSRFLRDHIVGCESAYLSNTAAQVGIRQTRQVVGQRTLRNADVVEGKKCEDAIAISPWPIELHSGTKPKVEWLLDDVYQIPYGCFVPQAGEGLLVAGRCLSAEHEAVASARVTAQCFSYGHAIGHAAVVAVNNRIAPREVDVGEIQSLLLRDGAVLK